LRHIAKTYRGAAFGTDLGRERRWRLPGPVSQGAGMSGGADALPAIDRHRPSLLFLWESFGPHHVDRCEACAAHFAGRFDVYGVEIATFDANYQWRGSVASRGFVKVTLFPSVVRQKIGHIRCFLRILRTCLRLRSRYVFLCNFNEPAIFLAAVTLRLLGRRLVVMNDSKFDDKPRRLLKELVKSVFYRPYHAALASGHRTKSYLTFIGFPEDRVAIGYDTVSTERIRALAGVEPAPGGVPHSERHFTIVARFVPKKNLSLALDAYAIYAAQHPGTPRELHLCGSGELEPQLRDKAARLGLAGIKFRGFQPEPEIARILGSSLALILPSVEEQHGLVVNEALAMGVPVLLSDNCGARDLLVRAGINGYVFEADNAAGLAHLMSLLDRDAEEWERLSRGTRSFEELADTRLFVAAVEQVIGRLDG
jgi:glycosyltransferase involved in cell wall biosynthesis